MNFTKIPDYLSDALSDLTGNELAVVPADGDFGFSDYLTEKTGLYMERKKLYDSPRRHQLLLRYPDPDVCRESTFLSFFGSPQVLTGGSEFLGCFAIDITDYKGRTNLPEFKRLMGYVLEHREIHFIFLLFENDESAISDMYNALSGYDAIDLVRFSYPSPANLAAYITDKYSGYLSEPLTDELAPATEKFLAGGKYEYDYAERLVQELINRECGSDEELIIKTLHAFAERKPTVKKAFTMGFTARKED